MGKGNPSHVGGKFSHNNCWISNLQTQEVAFLSLAENSYICLTLNNTQMEKFKCCLCDKEVEGFGNNPEPLGNVGEDEECCDECNAEKVIPARINRIIQ